MSASHHDWLVAQLPEWEREGLITAESASVLKQRAQAAGARGGQLGLVIFGAIGSLLVAGGIIALLAHNWDDLPRWARLVLAFTPMAVGQVLTAWVLQRGPAIADWIRESVAAFFAIGTGTTLAMVSQIYNMGGRWETFLVAWCLLSVPVMWLLRSGLVASLYLIGITIWVQSQNHWWDERYSLETLPWYPLLLLLLLGWWPGPQWRTPPAMPLGFRWIAAPCLMSVMMSAADYRDLMTPLALAAVFVLLPDSEKRVSRRPFLFVGSLLLLGCALFLHFNSGRSEHYSDSSHSSPVIVLDWVLLALAVILAVPAVKQRRWAVLGIASVVLLPFIGSVVGDNTLWLIATVQLVGIGILMVLPAFRGEEGAPRLGALLISSVILTRFVDSDLPLTAKGLGFIFVGVCFIVFNIVLARRKRQSPSPTPSS